MTYHCNGICKRYKTQGHSPSGGRYRNGQKRCSGCDEYIFWSGMYCPCCKGKLRTKPRNRKYKEKFRAATNVTSRSTISSIRDETTKLVVR